MIFATMGAPSVARRTWDFRLNFRIIFFQTPTPRLSRHVDPEMLDDPLNVDNIIGRLLRASTNPVDLVIRNTSRSVGSAPATLLSISQLFAAARTSIPQRQDCGAHIWMSAEA